VTFSDLVLRRRFDGDKELINWIKECVQKNPVKKSGSVILKDDMQKEVLRWNFTNAWPTSYEPPRLSSDDQGRVTTETIVLNVESLELA
jgi:phage tail-like protein